MNLHIKFRLNFNLLFVVLYIGASDARSNLILPKSSLQLSEPNLCDIRRSPGLICESCDRMALCVQMNGLWQTYPVEPCDTESGYFCNIQEKKCSKSPGPCNRLGYEGNFACTSDGIFPDPYDCQKYHMCYHAQSMYNSHLPIAGTANCLGDNAYSVINSDCSAKISDEICKKQPYECRYPGDNNSWPGNDNIFYICQPEVRDGNTFLYPTLYRCAPNEIYNGINCVNTMNMNPTTSTITSNHNNSTTKTTLTTATKLDSCQMNGIGLKADRNDCRSYYHCTSKSLPPKWYTCPNQTYFEERTLSCQFGDCVNN